MDQRICLFFISGLFALNSLYVFTVWPGFGEIQEDSG